MRAYIQSFINLSISAIYNILFYHITNAAFIDEFSSVLAFFIIVNLSLLLLIGKSWNFCSNFFGFASTIYSKNGRGINQYLYWSFLRFYSDKQSQPTLLPIILSKKSSIHRFNIPDG